LSTWADLRAEPIGPGAKGFPNAPEVTLGTVAAQKWNVFAGDLPLPVMVLRESALAHNLRTMASWCRERGVDLAPHGKTTMAPQLFRRQLDAGAWAITAATVAQARLMRAFGVERVLIANQVADAAGIRWLAAEAGAGTGWVACLVDSRAGVALLTRHWRDAGGTRPIPVLVELGMAGGRTGCRSAAALLDVASAVADSPALELAGVEGYEGIVHDPAAVDGFLSALRSAAESLAGRGLFGTEAIVSAGGSAFFDRVVAILGGVDLGVPTRLVLRSGCYLTHDSGFYEQFSPLDFQPAIEVVAVVLSRPEPDLALVGMGKRDVPFDIDLPFPLPAERGLRVVELNDQHAFVRVPESDPLAPGDVLSFGISHPCTAFDKWRLIPVIDDSGTVIDAVRTFF
jgi:D-serine deaminase-like pyridoxal phosphate-dependent protein